MILGFAHLAVNVADITQAEAQWRKEGYSCIADHRDVPNHSTKKMFCSCYQPLHSLALLSGPGLWPLELTYHGPTRSINKQIAWNRDAIQITVPDPMPLSRLLVDGLGFHEYDQNSFLLESRFPSWSCRLRLEKGDTQQISLDDAGFTCLAFYSSHCDEDAQRLLQLAATDYTGCYNLSLGKRNMMIAMLRAPGGPLLELITPRREI